VKASEAFNKSNKKDFCSGKMFLKAFVSLNCLFPKKCNEITQKFARYEEII